MPTPKPVIPSPLAWSYSRLTMYQECPRKFFFNVIEKRKEPSNEYMDRGSALHKAAENTLLKPKSKIPQDLMRLKKEIVYYRAMKATPEVQYTFTHQLKGTTGWFEKDAWLRVKLDVLASVSFKEAWEYAPKEVEEQSVNGQLSALTHGLHIGDWKSGQFKPERSVDQLELYALTGFLTDPKAAFVLTSLHYIDVGRSVHSYWDNPKSVVRLKAKWLKKVGPMQKDRVFKAKVTANCKYCFYSKTKGGPCKAA